MRAAVIANGEIRDTEFLRQGLEKSDVVIVCDGGARHAAAVGVLPHFVVGDMDSAPAGLLDEYAAKGVEFRKVEREKDFTDLELGLSTACEIGAEFVDIYSALGGRADHAMANILALTQTLGKGVFAAIREPDCDIYAMEDELVLRGQEGDVVTLLPIGDAQVVATEGLLYPLRGETLRAGFARGVSNVMTGGAAKVSVKTGTVVVFHSFHHYGDGA